MQNKNEMAALAQKVQITHSEIAAQNIKSNATMMRKKIDAQEEEINNLEINLKTLFDLAEVDITVSESAEEYEFMTEEEKFAIYDFVHRNDNDAVKTIAYQNEEQYYSDVEIYLKEQGFSEEVDPMFHMFSTEETLQKLRTYDEKFKPLKWTKADYIAVGLSATVAILLDIFIVAIPEDMKFLGKEYKGSKVTQKIKEITTKWYENEEQNSKFGQWMHNALKALEEYAKVPYDKAGNNKAKGINIDGFGPQFHRLMEPGHDVILGFIFGVLDILRGTCTVIDKNGVLHVLDVGDSSINILGAFIKVFAHFISDVFTSAGIAPPFLSILQLCTGKSPFILKENGERVTFNNLVRFMYKHGYDMRHMLTMSIVPMVIELSVRTYFYLSNGAIDLKIIEDKRYKLKKTNMLMLSHSITMLGNVFKMFLYGWNPLAFNYSEFLILIKTAIVTIKSRSDYSQWVDKQLEDEWKEILSYNH